MTWLTRAAVSGAASPSSSRRGSSSAACSPGAASSRSCCPTSRFPVATVIAPFPAAARGRRGGRRSLRPSSARSLASRASTRSTRPRPTRSASSSAQFEYGIDVDEAVTDHGGGDRRPHPSGARRPAVSALNINAVTGRHRRDLARRPRRSPSSATHRADEIVPELEGIAGRRRRRRSPAASTDAGDDHPRSGGASRRTASIRSRSRRRWPPATSRSRPVSCRPMPSRSPVTVIGADRPRPSSPERSWSSAPTRPAERRSRSRSARWPRSSAGGRDAPATRASTATRRWD